MLKKNTVLLAGGLLLVWVAAYVLIGVDDSEDKFLSPIGYVSAAVVATAIITFFGILGFETNDEANQIPDQRLRSAIAASSTVTYLVLIATAGLFTHGGELIQGYNS